jgi:hypothetical protein
MGLDMYLTAKYYYGGKWKEPGKHNEGHTLEISGDFVENNELSVGKIQEITEEVAYWRKANAIHSWFVTNCQDGNDDCREYYISIDQLKTLLKACEEVLEMLDNKDFDGIYTLLPPKDGFFFGTTDIEDPWYKDDIRYTVKQLNKIINSNNKDCEFYYQSSW